MFTEPTATESQRLDETPPEDGFDNERRVIVYQTTSLTLSVMDDRGNTRVLAQRSSPPVYSPDGRQVAYSRLPDSYQPGEPVERADLYVFDLKAGRTEQLTRGYDDTEPVWTQDGRNVLFQSTRRSGRPSLWKVRENGTGLDQLTNETRVGGASYIPNPASSSTVQWAPNERRVIVYSTTSLTNGEVRIIDFSRLLEVESAYFLGVGHSPRWTNEGTVIFKRDVGGSVVEVEMSVD